MPDPKPEAAPRDVQAAGMVVFRPGKQVLLVHRPKYDDWSFPKGKVDRGEHTVATAVREVAEETGLHARLGPPLTPQRYQIGVRRGRRMKTVHYWVGRPVGSDDVSDYRPNHEIDQVEWFDHDKALRRLTYAYDRLTLEEALSLRQKTVALVVLRHGEARSRKAWRVDDRLRPLLKRGELQAQQLVALLAAYDVGRVLTSSSTRCLQTVQPYADTADVEAEPNKRLSEEKADPGKVRTLVDDVVVEALRSKRGAVICSHRPVFPMIFDALGVDDPGLGTGEMLVLHLRKGYVIGTEQHRLR